MNNKYYAVCGIVTIDGKVLLVRHTYGVAKDKLLLPGGHVREGELPTDAVVREIREETGVLCRPTALFAVQFTANQWCAVFETEYLEGTPVSDGYENSEVRLMTPEEAVAREDMTNLSRAILKAYIQKLPSLEKSSYVGKYHTPDTYAIFGV